MSSIRSVLAVTLTALTLAISAGACGSANAEELNVYTHCGWYQITFEDQVWVPTNIALGSMPEGTDSMSTKGSVVRDGETLIFTAESGLEVVFELAAEDPEPVPPCD